MISLKTTVLSARMEAVAQRRVQIERAAKYFIKKQPITEGDRALGSVSPPIYLNRTELLLNHLVEPGWLCRADIERTGGARDRCPVSIDSICVLEHLGRVSVGPGDP